MTICYECKNFINLAQNSCREHIWYNHICLASPSRTRVNPVTGMTEFIEGDESGYMYCRDVNFGNCDKFEKGKNSSIFRRRSI